MKTDTTTQTAAAEVAAAPTQAPKAGKRARTGATVAPAKAKASKATTTAKKAATAAASRDGSKKAIVIGLMRTRTGATMGQIMKATDWQTHTVRGFVSGMVTKKMGLKVESTRTDSGERCYKIAAK